MGSSHFGEPNLGSERSGNSRKGRKSSSEKPKQPQRGLGVAQLEKIRLHSQMGYSYLPPPPHSPFSHCHTQEDIRRQTATYSSSSSLVDSPKASSCYGFPGNPSIPTDLSSLNRQNVGYADSQADIARRWPHGYVVVDAQQFTQPIITRQLFEHEVEDSLEKKGRKDRINSIGSSSHHESESSGNQDLDLELRLSL